MLYHSVKQDMEACLTQIEHLGRDTERQYHQLSGLMQIADELSTLLQTFPLNLMRIDALQVEFSAYAEMHQLCEKMNATIQACYQDYFRLYDLISSISDVGDVQKQALANEADKVIAKISTPLKPAIEKLMDVLNCYDDIEAMFEADVIWSARTKVLKHDQIVSRKAVQALQDYWIFRCGTVPLAAIQDIFFNERQVYVQTLAQALHDLDYDKIRPLIREVSEYPPGDLFKLSLQYQVAHIAYQLNYQQYLPAEVAKQYKKS